MSDIDKEFDRFCKIKGILKYPTSTTTSPDPKNAIKQFYNTKFAKLLKEIVGEFKICERHEEWADIEWVAKLNEVEGYNQKRQEDIDKIKGSEFKNLIN